MAIPLDLSDLVVSTDPDNPDVWGAALKAHIAALAAAAAADPTVATVSGSSTISKRITVVSSAGGANTQTLPDATTVAGQTYTIIKTSTDGNLVTVAPQSGQTIAGAAHAGLLKTGHVFTLVSDGTATWRVTRQPLTLASTTPDYTLLTPLSYSGTTQAPIDPTNLSLTFVCPPSGRVKVRQSFDMWAGGTATLGLCVIDVATGGTVIHSDNTAVNETTVSRVQMEYEVSHLATGVPLVPGQVYTWQAGWHVLGGSGTLHLDNALELFEIEAMDTSDTPRTAEPVIVQNPTSGTTTTASASTTIAKPVAGNLLIAFVQANVTSAGNWSIASAGGGTWTKVATDVAVPSVARRCGMYWRVATSADAAGSVTFSATGSTATAVHVVEVSGFTGTPTLDQAVSASGGPGLTCEIDGTVNTSTAPELLAVCWGTASTGVTLAPTQPPPAFADSGTISGGVRPIHVVGIPRVQGTLPSSVAWCGLYATFTGV